MIKPIRFPKYEDAIVAHEQVMKDIADLTKKLAIKNAKNNKKLLPLSQEETK